MPSDPGAAFRPDYQPVANAVVMTSDCTIRSIDAAYRSVRDAVRRAAADDVLSIDCAAIEQVDVTFVQLLVSAAKTSSARRLRLALHAPPTCVQDALSRSGVELGALPFSVS